MTEESGSGPSVGKIFVIAIVVSALVGLGTGYFAASLANSKAPVAREFWVFSVVLPFNSTLVGQPHDYFAPDRIVVNRGDTVTIHFYNTEDEPEPHTFTIAAPYSLNYDIGAGQKADFTFVASTSGIFAFRCTYHQPSMTGYLVVLG